MRLRIWGMDLFCVRAKPRKGRGKHSKKEARKDRERCSRIVHIEARPRDDFAKKKKQREKRENTRPRPREQTYRPSAVMASYQHPSPPSLRTNMNTPTRERRRACTSCCLHAQRGRGTPSPQNTVRDLGCGSDAAPSQMPSPTPSPSRRVVYDKSPEHQTPVGQVYVHPYSVEHYRFPVVDHSTTCRGHRAAPHPACYMALVPKAATPRDIEAALAHRPGLVAMARLSATEDLVNIRTFHCTTMLHEASLQLEVWDRNSDIDNVV
ncbi:hypothetical protein F4777DRAFT_378593 [Nemania sp. FL0916]|nr:hypothetical protein F4777DRAFT_378593 [Nemania sp. FL0916]